MKRRNDIFIRIIVFAASVMTLASCALTRTETDYYTITDRERAEFDTVRVDPGSPDDNGVVFPSGRRTEINRNTLSHDSTYDRKYPNFLRQGGIEFAGLMGSSSTNGLGMGLFGIFSLLDADKFTDSVHATLYNQSGTTTGDPHLFKGELIRFEPFEWRLRWFGDAPDWTIGWSAYELLAPDEIRKDWLWSLGVNAYLRKRFWIRDRVPYVLFSPFIGVSAFPSAYVNLGGELQLGSYGGMNLRAYAGLAAGKNLFNFTTPIVDNTSSFHAFPYLGLGISFMDFTNRPIETEREWKDHTHSALNINVFEISLLKTSGDTSFFTDGTPFQGIQMKLLSVEYPLPIFNDHFWAGTSLLNIAAPSFYQWAAGILPLRVGYRQYIFAEDLMVEPFIEYNYYPSSFYNLGARLKLDTYSGDNIGITAGYMSGSPGNFAATSLNNVSGGSYPPGIFNFSTWYIGVSFFLGDRNYSPEKINALHASQP